MKTFLQKELLKISDAIVSKFVDLIFEGKKNNSWKPVRGDTIGWYK